MGLYSRTLGLHAEWLCRTKVRLVNLFSLVQSGKALYTSSMPPRQVLQLATTPIPTVIVVDGDPSMRRALRTQLQAAGFNILVFESTESLLESELPTENACLLLDIYLMPKMTSVELSRSLAAERRLPTVLMSSSDDELTIRLMNEAKAVARLFKPFDERALLGAIRKALRKQSKLQP
jgi:FixJ family two-component response regulator